MSDFPEFQHKPEKKLTYKEKVQKGLIHGGLRPVSEKQQKRLNEYNKSISKDTEQDYICVFPGCGCRETLSRHHYKGRGKHITEYIYLCQTHHDYIHANAKWAKEEGWLHPEIDGKPSDPNQKIPW